MGSTYTGPPRYTSPLVGFAAAGATTAFPCPSPGAGCGAAALARGGERGLGGVAWWRGGRRGGAEGSAVGGGVRYPPALATAGGLGGGAWSEAGVKVEASREGEGAAWGGGLREAGWGRRARGRRARGRRARGRRARGRRARERGAGGRRAGGRREPRRRRPGGRGEWRGELGAGRRGEVLVARALSLPWLL